MTRRRLIVLMVVVYLAGVAVWTPVQHAGFGGSWAAATGRAMLYALLAVGLGLVLRRARRDRW